MNACELGKNYDKIASWWDKTINPQYGVKYLDRAISLCQSRNTALDVGCGSGGRMIEAMQEAGYKITALDASQCMLEIAKQKHTDVNFIYSDFLDWESEEAFDLVVAWDSIFHAPQRDQASILFKLCAHLAPEGILIFTGGDEDGDIQGSDMQGVPFEYGSISYMKRLEIIEQSHCDIFIMERDQPPHPGHVVFICRRRNDGKPPSKPYLDNAR